MTTADFEIAPCLVEGPIAEAGRDLVSASRSLSDRCVSSTLRAWVVAHLFQKSEQIFAAAEDPTPPLNAAIMGTAAMMREVAGISFPQFSPVANGHQPTKAEDVETITGNHYGNLFHGFSQTAFWEETSRLLRTRLERNGITLESVKVSP